jgi:transposase
MSSRDIKKLNESDADKLLNEPFLISSATNSISTIQFLSKIIKDIERPVKSIVKLKPEFEYLLTMPGIGDILGLTIMLEVGDISRFTTVGKYSSYCRCVKSERISNKKKKGEGNRKNGNKYLSWAEEAVQELSKAVISRPAMRDKLCEKSYCIENKPVLDLSRSLP